jgi:hypothetical protein
MLEGFRAARAREVTRSDRWSKPTMEMIEVEMMLGMVQAS